MPRPKEVKITKDGQEGRIMRESVEAYKRLGWTVEDDGGSEQSSATAPPSVAEPPPSGSTPAQPESRKA